MTGSGAERPRRRRIYEKLPRGIAQAMAERAAWFANLPAPEGGGLEFAASDVQAWQAGETIRVAFLGGDTALHRDIADATRVITEACNLVLDFGYDEGTDAYRTWSEDDEEYAAEIRVSFDRDGYWSLVGTDSIDPEVDDDLDGGNPWQRSLNLEGFDQELPEDWRGTVRHEFMHALGFHHEHQNLRGPCEQEFRWKDDKGYKPTTDDEGTFVPDAKGRRPGIYTYLGGPPNEWTKEDVDLNLRRMTDPTVVLGPFDPASVMLYQFEDFFYRSDPSPCAPTGDGVELSAQDLRGLVLLYGAPPTEAGLEMGAPQAPDGPPLPTYGTAARRASLRAALESLQEGGLEAAGGDDRAARLLARLARPRRGGG